jgi:hypothetical protein
MRTEVQLNDEDEMLDASIDLAVRLLLMLEVGRIRNCFSGYRELIWERGSLQEFVADSLKPRQTPSNERVKLEKTFVAKNLGRIAGIQIVWTDNLADHLRLLEHDTQVAIFQHASFLELVRHR